MSEIRGQQFEIERKIVVRGAPRLNDVWPLERTEVAMTATNAEVGGIDAVTGLLASIEGEDPATYRARYPLSIVALRALTAHCHAAILQAAMRVGDDLTPEAVLTELHATLRTPIDPLLERLAS